MMSSPEKVKKNWRWLLGSSLAVLSASFHSLALITECQRGQAWQTQVSPRPGGNSGGAHPFASRCCAFWDCWEGSKDPQPALVHLTKGVWWCWGGHHGHLHHRGLQGGWSHELIHREEVNEPKVGDLFLVVGDSGVTSSMRVDRGSHQRSWCSWNVAGALHNPSPKRTN